MISRIIRVLNKFPTNERGLSCGLRFQNASFEKKYNNIKIPFQVLILKILSLTLVTLSSSIFFSNPLSINLLQIHFIIPFLAALGMLLLLYFFVANYFRKKVELAILCTVIAFIIGSGEISKWILFERDWTSGFYWIFGVNLQTGCLFLIIARVRWTRCSLALLLSQSYIWFRVLDPEQKQQTFSPAVITFSVYAILLPLLSFAGEREDRKLFLDVQIREGDLEAFKNLIKEVLPSSVVIFDKEKLLFFNEKIKEIFHVETSQEIMELLGRIKV